MSNRLVDVRTGVLAGNDERAAALREAFRAAGVAVVNLVSSPGTGKTALLEELLRRTARDACVAALVGDCATDNDARRLARSGAPVVQVVTEGLCHLEADLVAAHLPALARAGAPLEELDVLFVENVGNLVCPASFDLGETLRVVLLSVTEGEDKPLKYPALFSSSDVAVLTKTDLADAVGFDRAAALGALEAVNPGLRVVETSARTGEGVDALAALLLAARPAPAAAG